jgi:uncharacterized membrane protein
MLKQNKITLIITTLVLLLPVAVGLLLWNQLPESIPIHWNVAGEVDGWGSRAMAVFFLPLFVLAIHWICFFATCADPKNKNANGKPIKLVLWICPLISLLLCTVVYAAALGYDLSIEILMPVLMGILFVIIGNYMPKCKQNYTIGIKLPWTLNSEENWNRTHRFAGWIWVIGGCVVMATAVLGNVFVMLGATLVMAIIPVIYSYLFYRKSQKEEQ